MKPETEGKEFVKEFKVCPACGSKERFFETLVADLRERGLTSPGWGYYLDAKRGVVFDKTKEAVLLIGSTMPAFAFYSDICVDCGTIYVVKLQKMTAQKSLDVPVPSNLPNRAERRRNGGGQNILFNNPLMS